jgi:hypothetical protein
MPGMADIFKIIIHFIVRSFLNNDREILAYWQQLFNEENLIKHLRVAHWIVLLRARLNSIAIAPMCNLR